MGPDNPPSPPEPPNYINGEGQLLQEWCDAFDPDEPRQRFREGVARMQSFSMLVCMGTAFGPISGPVARCCGIVYCSGVRATPSYILLPIFACCFVATGHIAHMICCLSAWSWSWVSLNTNVFYYPIRTNGWVPAIVLGSSSQSRVFLQKVVGKLLCMRLLHSTASTATIQKPRGIDNHHPTSPWN